MKHITLIFLLLASSLIAIDRPNILLILSDDHSLPHLGIYGDKNCQLYKLTPNLDALAAEGMRFTKAYTASPQCAPSRISIFAGQSPVALSYQVPNRISVLLQIVLP